MDLFIIKKFIGELLMPLPLIMVTLVLSIFFMLRDQKRRSLLFASIATLSLVLVSYAPLPNALLKPLERQYSQFDLANKVNYIVVLGCQHVNDSAIPITAQVSPCSVIRSIEAMRILQFNPNAKIITSGNVGRQPYSNAYMNKQLLISLGVQSSRIIEVERSRDTQEEAQNLAKLVMAQPFALVTSASHMKRAMFLFKRQNLAPFPAPTEHLIRDSDSVGLGQYFPNSRNIKHSERWWYEWMGNTWVKFNAWLNS